MLDRPPGTAVLSGSPTRSPATNYTPGDWSGQSLRRAAPDGRLISLNEARRTRQGSSVRPLARPDRGLVIPWPWAPQEPASDDRPTLTLQLPSLEELQRWIPTAIFLGAIVALIVFGLVVRAIVLWATGEGAPASQPVVEVPAPIVQQLPAEPVAAAPQIRFESRPLQPTYTVITGDTLSAIAQRFSSTTVALRGINNLTDDAILGVGQRLVIP